jgi:hypothetical protein
MFCFLENLVIVSIALFGLSFAAAQQVCDPVTGNYYFYAFKWPNSSCAFLCQEVRTA